MNTFRQRLNQSVLIQLCITAFIVTLPQYWLKIDLTADLPNKADMVLSQMLNSSALQLDIFKFISALLIINIILIGLTWILTVIFCRFLHLSKRYWGNIGIGLYLTITLFIFFDNAVRFPTSHYAYFFTDTYGISAVQISRNILLAAFLGFTAFIVIGMLKSLHLQRIRKKVVLAGGIVLIIPLTILLTHGKPIFAKPNQDKPNVILIGIDSVSSIHVSQYPQHMPFISGFIDQSAYFDNTTTPLARTFPAWISILTGLYPKHHGARFNLYDFNQIDLENTLPKILKNKGYTTVFAMDERRFSNIDESYGFDYTIGPKIGAMDFILPNLADSPLVNLAVASPAGHQLFPQLALNVAAHRTYEPSRFVKHILGELTQLDQKPKFIASHFCLAHFPFEWRNHDDYRKHVSPVNTNIISKRHIAALKRIDQQVESYFIGLQEQGLLDNAIVILLSDHGEATGNSDDILVRKNNYVGRITEAIHTQITNILVQPRYGHGVSTLSPTQQQSILAIRSFVPGKPTNIGKTSMQSSLVDIAPTILNMLDIAPPPMDGIPLIKTTMPNNKYDFVDIAQRATFLETGITFHSMVDLAQFDPSKLLAESLSYYEIVEESGRLRLKPEHYDKLISRKQRSIVLDHWQLALMSYSDGRVQVLLLDNNKQQWTYDFSSSLAKQAPVKELFTKLTNFYSNEIDWNNTCGRNIHFPPSYCSFLTL